MKSSDRKHKRGQGQSRFKSQRLARVHLITQAIIGTLVTVGLADLFGVAFTGEPLRGLAAALGVIGLQWVIELGSGHSSAQPETPRTPENLAELSGNSESS